MASSRVRDLSTITVDPADLFYVADSSSGEGKAALSALPIASRIGEVALSSTATSIAFSSIPGTFRHLHVVGFVRTDRAVAGENMYLSVNSDTTDANYDCEFMTAAATTVAAAEVLAAAGSRFVATANGASATANHFTAFELIIPDYAGAQRKFYETRYWRASARTTGTLTIGRTMNTWASTSAITALSFTPVTGPNFISGCRVTLYGVN